MIHRLSAARRIWIGRKRRTTGDRAFFVYSSVLFALLFAVPVGRAIWLGISSERAVAILAAPQASGVAMSVVVGMCSAASFIGAVRGPALLPPFLTFAWGTSPFGRATVWCTPVGARGCC